MGGSEPRLTQDSLGLSELKPETAAQLVLSIFAQMTGESLYFTMGRPFNPQNCPFQWGDVDRHMTWFLGSTWDLNPSGISIGWTVFAGLRSVTDSIYNFTMIAEYKQCDVTEKS